MAGATPPSAHRKLLIPPWWEEAAAAICGAGESAPVVVVCGPKNSGKSTFARHLLNCLLPRYKKVGFLDTDVGQPEFSPPGCLSLHVVDEIITDLLNPSLRAAEKCFFFGDTSSKRDPEVYLSCVFSLCDYFIKCYRYKVFESAGNLMTPLIVNTHGWVKGTGFDILVDMLRYICPTVVVQIRISVERKNLPTGRFWLDGEQMGPPEMINIASSHHDSSNRSVLIQKDACGMRNRRLLEYFKQCFPSDISIATNKELAYALASLPPYEVTFSKIKVMHLHCQVPSSEIWHSLNATIVGLAVSSDRPEKVHSRPWCVGLGIVRGVDVSRGLLYVITPVPHHRLQNVDLLLQGFIEIPTILLQVRGCVSPYMSTNVLHRISDKFLYQG